MQKVIPHTVEAEIPESRCGEEFLLMKSGLPPQSRIAKVGDAELDGMVS